MQYIRDKAMKKLFELFLIVLILRINVDDIFSLALLTLLVLLSMLHNLVNKRSEYVIRSSLTLRSSRPDHVIVSNRRRCASFS